MFFGEYTHSIDEKGRLTVPVRYRQLLAEGGYITQGFDQNLMVLRTPTFENMVRNVTQQSLTHSNVRELGRALFSLAERIEPDGSGRILIPQFLRDELKLAVEVSVVGTGNYFEIWAPALWGAQKEKLRNARNDSDHFAGLNLFANEA
jgi:MraZ protein